VGTTGRRWRETNAGATCTAVRDGDVRTYERTKVGLSYDSVCSRGPALDPAKRIFFLFFISSSAAPPYEPSAMHHLRFTPVRPPLRPHRCAATPPSRPITIPPQPSSRLESSIPPTLPDRECPVEYLRFVHRPSFSSYSSIFFFLPSSSSSAAARSVVVLYSRRMKRSGRLSPLIASRVTVREALTFGISLSLSLSLSPSSATGLDVPSLDVERAVSVRGISSPGRTHSRPRAPRRNER